MCGRYALHSSPGVVALQFGLAHPPQFAPRYNVGPGTEVLVVRPGAAGERVGSAMRWGLVPAWAKDPSIGNRLINARAETLAEKPSFRSAFRRRRCLIPADGFYEWKATGGRKQPYYARSRDGEVLGFAGLYEHWDGPGGRVDTCTIVTTEANALIREVHERMPVILPVEAYAHWLDPDNPDPISLIALLRPCDPDRLTVHAVATRVNDVRNDDAALVQPTEADLLF